MTLRKIYLFRITIFFRAQQSPAFLQIPMQPFISLCVLSTTHIKRRRNMRKTFQWVKRIFLGLLIVLALLLAGFLFEQISRAKADKIQPGGQFATIGNHRLHYVRKGTGGPTVVFETAFDPAGHLQWHAVQQQLPPTFTTLSYDRAGILWSERGDASKTGSNMAEELHALLEASNVPKPYILVGHSFGGTLIRFYVRSHPQHVAGVILVDSQCPNDKEYLSDDLYKLVNQGLPSGFLKFANTFGIARLLFRNMFPADEPYTYPNAIMPALLHKSAHGVLEEQDAMAAIKEDASAITSFGSVPLCVISAADKSRFDSFIRDNVLKTEMTKAWSTMQEDMLHLSTDSRQIVVSNGGHYLHQDQPEIMKEAIQAMISRVTANN
jgi:pimeloyl-ACP methyl ester carboxylesterase